MEYKENVKRMVLYVFRLVLFWLCPSKIENPINKTLVYFILLDSFHFLFSVVFPFISLLFSSLIFFYLLFVSSLIFFLFFFFILFFIPLCPFCSLFLLLFFLAYLLFSFFPSLSSLSSLLVSSFSHLFSSHFLPVSIFSSSV